MDTQSTGQLRRHFQARVCATALLLAASVGCGPVNEGSGLEAPGSQAQALHSENSATLNGLAMNGLATNGLATNGLATNGLNSDSFQSWFQQDPALAELVMRYIIACAIHAGETRTYTYDGKSYVWNGALGLAPDWASGLPATVTEQQLVSACLAAHVNKYGRSVSISVQGADARRQPIPSSQQELQDFSQREGCFFGNLFTQEGVYVGNDGRMLGSNESSVRACALASENSGGDACAPIDHIGSCTDSCTLDPTGTYYSRCTRDGITYVPITTRIRPQDIYTCGDGVCQFTESCGLGLNTVQCTLDCGICL